MRLWRRAVRTEDGVARVKVEHLGGLDGTVVEVFVGRVEGVVDAEVLDTAADSAGGGQGEYEPTTIAMPSSGKLLLLA